MINHPDPLKQESTQETLPAVFLMEKRCAPVSPSSHKHEALAVEFVMSLSLSRCPRLNLSVSSLGSPFRAAGQATAGHAAAELWEYFLSSSPEATFIHERTFWGSRAVQRGRPPGTEPECVTGE